LRSYAYSARADLNSYSFVTLCAGREGQEQRLRAELQRFIGKPPLQFMQLEARELLAPERRRGREPSKYRVQDLDLSYFAPQIDRFVRAIACIEPQSASESSGDAWRVPPSALGSG
jgi:hypothetical protein